ncbi:helix-turn-helix domain-containing protein [Streptomyces spongiae]|uniref:Helix-turn-helix domain-containing protein n=1 Tax=Streptomyces spongiae TaxID=565072 RepID=A0A5N8XDH6_9ACTN|nr:helix-turn-helix transcriptional regulator [Streptomyces spongiae]MPY57499.1 helix-turn-helix domain-containing protein [Streptomyces spongiae]
MRPVDANFGEELRRRRTENGLSLDELATLVNFSKGHLSKIERGKRNPSEDLAHICDTVLHAEGGLRGLLSPPPHQNMDIPATNVGDSIPWSLWMRADGESDFVAVDPAVLASGNPALPMVSWTIVPGFHENGSTEAVLPVFRNMFHEFRGLGQFFGPAVVAQLSITATSALRGMGRSAPPEERGAVLRLAARFAEYTGWMAQEAGNDAATLWWTDQAVRLAAAGGDSELAAYALVRQAELALYSGDSLTAVGLSREAGAQARSGRIRELAAQREAQGHALVGNRDECRRALDRSAELAGETEPSGDGTPVLGSVHVPDLTAFVSAWCMQELGAPAEAVALLEPGLDTIDPQALRARARHGARLALALAHVGELERACTLAASVAAAVAATDSATIRADLVRLSRVLNRWPRNPAVRDALPLIAAGLRGGLRRRGDTG